MNTERRRHGRGEWITSARRVGRRAVTFWIVIGWLLVIPAFVYSYTGGWQ